MSSQADIKLKSQSRCQGCVIATENRQSDLVIAQQCWVGLMRLVLQAEGVAEPWEAGLWFVDATEMAKLNQLHRGIAQSTDVLALGTDDGMALRASGEPRLVGDVVICPSVAATHAVAHAKKVDEELALLIVHGTLHLLGYDHQQNADAVRMRQREQELLTQGLARGFSSQEFVGADEELREGC
ncbi:MAG: rRNA maturation RNase YbeY [Acidimicrobiia bacterium]|nr:rRNA maturation RNase YbeY [Acidimicrobiia bacterium]MYC57379.1 rRNA maturation RNase YbeY [Acidimicrobiia bacterium]MYG94582.1 rRNA maturation RNase YbeY [Acidimicrobiia bacterium]MYI31135.1 rRNA maturation RNase YbeY [Acidimicrobiia bacterium]